MPKEEKVTFDLHGGKTMGKKARKMNLTLLRVLYKVELNGTNKKQTAQTTTFLLHMYH